MAKRYYITTPIYYVNSVPHIGTALTTIAADVTARYQKMHGREVTFLTGTDENAIKVMEAAQQAGRSPQDWVDEVSQEFRRIWKGMKVDYDDFIRTTEPRHVRCVQEMFTRMLEAGHIYKGNYEGWYDVGSETFFREADLVDGKSPDGNEVRWVQEENYFFKLSAFGEPLMKHIEAHPKFILPEVRKNEVVGFIKQGLRDISITRANAGWGIPVPGDESKVIYVWFDALINYVSASGWPEQGWQDLWPADVQWMGKDILTRFHATLWPAMLLALGLPLPDTLVGHGWLTTDGEKISKSKGNVVAPVELAAELAQRAGCTEDVAIDVVRYFMTATMPFESDSDFTYKDFDQRYNSDLANDLGNALNRSLAMAHKFVDGAIPADATEQAARDAIDSAKNGFEAAMQDFRPDRAADAAWSLVRFLNKYIDTRAPWALAKAGDPALPAVLRSMLLCLRACEGLVRPIMPSVADAIASQLSLPPLTSWQELGSEASLPSGTKLQQPQPIFPRLDTKKSKDMEAPKTLEPKPESTPAAPAAAVAAPASEISIDDFAKVQFKVGRVLEATPVEDSDKLLKLDVMIGSEKRQIVAGIRKSYDPLDLIGRQVVVVVNLKPAKLRGVESQGMLLAADDGDGGAILVQPDREAPEGSKVR